MKIYSSKQGKIKTYRHIHLHILSNGVNFNSDFNHSESNNQVYYYCMLKYMAP